jgi:hypothetical protein
MLDARIAQLKRREAEIHEELVYLKVLADHLHNARFHVKL